MIEKLQSKETALYASLFTVLAVGTPHTVNIFAKLSQFEAPWNYVHGIAFSIGIEAGIVFFAMRSRIWQTIAFGVFSLVLNLGYYWAHILVGNYSAIVSVMIALSVPVMIILIAEEINREKARKRQEKPGKSTRSHLRRTNGNKVNGNVANGVKSITVNGNGIVDVDKKPATEKGKLRQQIFDMKEAGKTLTEIGEAVNLHKSTVSKILNGQRWAVHSN